MISINTNTQYRLMLFIILLALGNIAHGQKLTLTQLLTIYNFDKSRFDTYLIGRGYLFYKTEITDSYKRPIYTFKQKKELTANYISFFYYNTDNIKLLQYNTSSRDYYLAIKKELEAHKFKYSEDDDSKEDTQSFSYNKGNVIVAIVVKQQKTPSGESFNSYEIGLFKKK
jgi:hypothetical protein